MLDPRRRAALSSGAGRFFIIIMIIISGGGMVMMMKCTYRMTIDIDGQPGARQLRVLWHSSTPL